MNANKQWPRKTIPSISHQQNHAGKYFPPLYGFSIAREMLPKGVQDICSTHEKIT